MNVIRCKNGHFFDGDSYGTCPHCGETAMGSDSTAPVKEEKKGFWGRGRKDKDSDIQAASKISSVSPQGEFGNGNTPTDVLESHKSEENSGPLLKKNPTLDFWQTSSHPENTADEPIEEKVDIEMQENKEQNEEILINMQEEVQHSEPVSSLREAVKNASASNEGKTMSYFSSATNVSSAQSQPKRSAEPVVGWLVCVGGCHFGECFNIYAGKNSIGRSDENRVVICDDNSISRIKHALIVYEPKKRNFYLQPGDSSGLTYLNDDYITESHKLTAQDMVELGDSKFMFVPLCGEAFSWEDHMTKGE